MRCLLLGMLFIGGAHAAEADTLLSLASAESNEERLALVSARLDGASTAEERMALFNARAVLEALSEAALEDDGVVQALLVMALSEDPAVRAEAVERAEALAAEAAPRVVDDSTVLEAWEQPIEAEEAWEYAEPDPVAAAAVDAEHPAPAVNALGEPDRAAMLAYERGRLEVVVMTYSVGSFNADGTWTGGGWKRKREPRSAYLREAADYGGGGIPDSFGVVDGLGRHVGRWKLKRMTHVPRGRTWERDEVEMWVADYNRDLAEELGLGNFDLE